MTFEPAQLSVLITSYHIPQLVGQCLDSIQVLRQAGAEVLVCDVGDDPETLALCTERGVRLVRMANRGYSALINKGVQLAHGQWLLVLNGDAHLTAESCGSPDRLMQAVGLCQELEAGAFGLRHETPDARWQLSCWPFKSSIASELLRKLVTTGLMPARSVAATLDRLLTGPIRMQWVSGSALLAPRSSFVGEHRWDEGYFLFFEDIDWCQRLRQAGRDIYYYPSLSVVHAGGGSTASLGPEARRYFEQSQLRFFKAHQGVLSWQAMSWYQRLRRRVSSM